jgi:hypothetical protein
VDKNTFFEAFNLFGSVKGIIFKAF